MTIAAILVICILLLVAYLFDISSSKTKIPSVILLLLTGWIFRQITDNAGVHLSGLRPLLPLLGTLGLVLIVLEGSLELKLTRAKIPVIRSAAAVALFPMLAMTAILASVLHFSYTYPLHSSLTSVIPLCIISSAIAIPAVRNLQHSKREFITYESSLSDIFGVVLFNFFAFNEVIDGSATIHFILEIALMLVITGIASVLLAWLLKSMNHQVKYVPILLVIILIYSAAKLFHLPALIFILLFGLFLGNLEQWLIRLTLAPEGLPDLNKRIHQFHALLTEGTFLVRAFFFLLFGFMMENSDILNTESLPYALGTVLLILLLRGIFLLICRLPLLPELFVAPRGLITVLLFMQIPVHLSVHIVNKSLIIQIILISAILMMAGLIFTPNNQPEKN